LDIYGAHINIYLTRNWLSNGNITGLLADVSIYSGGALDIFLGAWLLTSIRIKLCCIVQIVTIFVFSILLTFIDASFWLHPFGPITKNFPIIVLIIFVYRELD